MSTAFLMRLKERKLVQWALAYLAGAWVLLQVAGELRDTFGWPLVVVQVLTVLLAVGFLAVLVLAWYHGEKGQQRVSGPELLMLSAILVLAGGVVWHVGRGSAEAGNHTAEPTQVEASGTMLATTAPVERSIAVLPFVNISESKENEYFSDGITEDILTSLSRIGGLKVISRTSVMQYKGTQKSLRQIGEELGVAHVLEGSVRRAGNRVRITAQLVDARTDEHLWAERYDRELTDLFAIQAEIAERIAEALRAELTEADLARLAAVPTEDFEAYQLYLQARHLWFEQTEDAHDRALVLYSQAIERDSSFALAYVGLAELYHGVALVLNGPDPARDVARARAAARRALELDSTLAGAHNALAFTDHWYRWEFDAAERRVRRALVLDPNYVVARFDYGSFLANMGRFDEAIAHHRRALELDPLTPWVAAEGLGRTLLYAGRADEAIPLLRRVTQTSPDSRFGHRWLAEAYLATGRMEEGLAEMKMAAALAPDLPEYTAALGYAFARAGRADDARRVLRELEARDWSRRPRPSAGIGRVHIALGERKAALDWLERAVRERDTGTSGVAAPTIGVEPAFVPLRTELRFQRLLREVGFHP